MNFDSFADFLAMGNHGLYVWLSYGVALVVIAANVLAVRRSRRTEHRAGGQPYPKRPERLYSKHPNHACAAALKGAPCPTELQVPKSNA